VHAAANRPGPTTNRGAAGLNNPGLALAGGSNAYDRIVKTKGEGGNWVLKIRSTVKKGQDENRTRATWI